MNHITSTAVVGEDDEAEGIGNISTDATDAPAYDVMGREVNDSYKGIVIKNGKKYIRK